ncbi:PREDICTED: preprotein translocase subunit SECE1 [Nelumbo nucifera]|uniref:Preprotein translocase subunit SECE1 n=2 Tax=Nelumbo nucifera TaxID=4432 RepID=A0A1U8B4S0_NELNU|nr:PREDICTED: preprotein translocase subunit SECE1 [Nelumbo nucifera]DAD33802.1 TPA_asm: hypothetical protein HUJ06_012653 [Nelumbo nucifera]
MALPSSLALSLSSTSTPPPSSVQSSLPVLSHSTRVANSSQLQLRRLRLTQSRKPRHLIKAIEEGQQQDNESATESTQQDSTSETETTANSDTVSLSELGSEIKEAMKTRKEREESSGGGDLWSGVAEEVREIEWPVFGKVLGTTGVVLGVIAGSSVVLLTVNAVLAELSDRIFSGKGVQDFFS